MLTEILSTASPKALKLARRLLREGEVIAFPADAGYCLGVNAFERFALRRLQALTGQDLVVFIYQVDDLSHVAQQAPNEAWPLLHQFWPGELTVLLPKNAALPNEVSDSRQTVAVRSPNHPLCLQLVVDFGRPLAVCSANRAGQPVPTTAEETAAQLRGRIPLVLDGGPSPVDRPPAVVDLSVTPPCLRQTGRLTLEALQQFLPTLTHKDEG